MRRLFLIVGLVFVLLVSSCSTTKTGPIPTPTSVPDPKPGTLYVHPKMEQHEISEYVLGSNHGPWIAVPVNMVEQANDSKVTMLRFPGGEWGDRNDTKPYHIVPFMQLCDDMGADVNFTVRVLDSTPEEAAEMVRLVNKEMGYGVEYWTIGNEPTLYEDYIQEPYDAARYNEAWREMATAMKKVDKNIKVIGPEVHQFNPYPEANPKDNGGNDWMISFLEANGDLVDVVSFHRYPFPKDRRSNASAADLREDANEWGATIEYLRGLIHEITGRDIPIAITEFNSHYTKAVGGDGTPDSFYNALWLADILGVMMEQNVLIANHWMLTSSGGYGGWGLVGRSEVFPSYYVYQMYDKFGRQMVYSSSDVEDLDIHASLVEEGTLSIVVINMGDEDLTYPIKVEKGVMGQVAYWLFDASHDAQNMGYIELDEEGMTFPAQSMSLFIADLP